MFTKIPTIIFVFGLILSLIVYKLTYDNQEEYWKTEFHSQVQKNLINLEGKLGLNEEILTNILLFYGSSKEVNREEFKKFVSRTLRRNDFIQALEWIPRISAKNRDLIEKRVQREGLISFQFTERQKQGSMVPAGVRSEYYPVLFVEPFVGNEKAIGFDLASNPIRLRALNKSRDSGKIMATNKIMLVQEEESQAGVLVYAPFYGTKMIPETIAERRENLKGFVLGVYRLGKMFEKIVTPFIEEGMNFSVYEGKEVSDHKKLYGNYKVDSLIEVDKEIEFSGQKWMILFQGDANFRGGVKTALPLANSGYILLFFIFISFITKVTHSRFSDQEAKRTADAANRAKSDFLSNMSHEIRTPLNAILGYAQILQMNGSLDSKQSDAVKTIENSGNHLLEIINHILDISKIEAGRIELNPVDFNLTSLLEGLAAMFKERCESKKLDFSLGGLDQKPMYVHGDEVKLRQVLVNLLGNAVKFTDQGRIRLELERAAGYKYVFRVRDTGAGISSKERTKIFQSFMQAEAGLHYGGTGLGLTISKELVEFMGGEIFMESQVGEGSCFSISLELHPAKRTVPPRLKRDRKAIRLLEGYSVKALVVDDVQENRKLLSEALRTTGIETLEAENGKEALECLVKFQPHIIFMDMQMPVMNGEETVKAIIQIYGSDRFKIVIITASAFDHQQEKLKLLGCDDYIMKPFRISHIHNCIKKLLNVEFESEDERQESQSL